MGDTNPIRTLRDYSKTSHEGYRNTIELPVGNNVVPLRSGTIRLVQNGCLFYGLRSEDPNQHLKDFLKLVDSLDLDGENRERMRLRSYYSFPCSILSTGKDCKTSQQYPDVPITSWRISLRSMDSFQGLTTKVPHHGIDLWLQVQIFYDHFNPVTRRTIDQSSGGKFRDKNAEESWALLEDISLYENESWNDPRDFIKSVKAISLPQDVQSTSDHRLIDLENQVKRLMEAHLAPTQPTQVKKITTSCKIFSGPHNTQYCMEDPEQAFVEYASLRTDEAKGKWYTFKLENQVQRLMKAHLAPMQPTQVKKITTSCEICSGPHDTQYCMKDPKQAFIGYASSRTDEAGASQDARLSKFKADFKRQQSEMTNKIDTVLEGITHRLAGSLPSDTVKNPNLSTSPVLSARSYPIIDPQCPSHPSTLINAIKTFLAHAPIYNVILDKYVESLELGQSGSAFAQGEVSSKMEDPGLFTLPCRLGDSKPFDTLADLGSCVNIIPLHFFKKLNIRLLEEIDHIFGLADETKSYPIRIVKDVEVHIRKLKLLNDFYVIDMKKDPETPLLVGRGFLATANAVIDCKMAKIAVGEGITRSVFGVKGVDLGEEEGPYWTTLGKGNHTNHALARMK
ncbi:MAK10-like protein [Tanacetum coccineum]